MLMVHCFRCLLNSILFSPIQKQFGFFLRSCLVKVGARRCPKRVSWADVPLDECPFDTQMADGFLPPMVEIVPDVVCRGIYQAAIHQPQFAAPPLGADATFPLQSAGQEWLSTATADLARAVCSHAYAMAGSAGR